MLLSEFPTKIPHSDMDVPVENGLRAPVSMGGPQGLRVRPGTLRTGPWPTTVDRCGSPACGVRVALVGLWVGQGLTQEETGAQSRYIRPGREWTPCEKTVPQTDAVPWLPGNCTHPYMTYGLPCY